jgi:hypothetical protein
MDKKKGISVGGGGNCRVMPGRDCRVRDLFLLRRRLLSFVPSSSSEAFESKPPLSC